MAIVLSLPAAGRLAERIVHDAGAPVTSEQIVTRLEALDIDTERAQAGIRLAVTVGRLEAISGDCLRIPARTEAAA